MTQAVKTVELSAPGMTRMQEMAGRMWLPMFLMGAMVLMASLKPRSCFICNWAKPMLMRSRKETT